MTGGVINRSNLYIEQQRLFWRYLQYSIGAHLVGFAIIFLYILIGPTREEPFQPAIQVDIVELPDFVKHKRKLVDTRLPIKDKPVPPPQPPKTKVKDDMLLNKKSSKLKKKNAPTPQKEALSVLERVKRQVERKRHIENQKLVKQRQRETKKFEDKFRNRLGGNNLNKGNSVSGTLATAINDYAGHVTEKIRNYWELPLYLSDKQNRAVVNLFVDANGEARYHFKKKSGDSVFDNLVEDAIDRATPFSPPPPELVGPLRRNGMEVRFPL